jgi:hypothetical protein
VLPQELLAVAPTESEIVAPERLGQKAAEAAKRRRAHRRLAIVCTALPIRWKDDVPAEHRLIEREGEVLRLEARLCHEGRKQAAHRGGNAERPPDSPTSAAIHSGTDRS